MLWPPFSAERRALRLHIGGVDGDIIGSRARRGQRLQHSSPEPFSRPTVETIVDRRGRSVFLGAVLPAAAAFQDMEDTADDAAIVLSTSAGLVAWHERLDRRPLLIVQPKQSPAHHPLPQKIGPRSA